jgi:hypothetical protein
MRADGRAAPERALIRAVQYAIEKGDRNNATPSLCPRRPIDGIGLVNGAYLVLHAASLKSGHREVDGREVARP